METYKVTIPEDKKAFFLQFLELIGASFQNEGSTSFVSEERVEYITESQKEELEKRISDDNAVFLDAREEQNKLREKYGL